MRRFVFAQRRHFALVQGSRAISIPELSTFNRALLERKESIPAPIAEEGLAFYNSMDGGLVGLRKRVEQGRQGYLDEQGNPIVGGAAADAAEAGNSGHVEVLLAAVVPSDEGDGSGMVHLYAPAKNEIVLSLSAPAGSATADSDGSEMSLVEHFGGCMKYVIIPLIAEEDDASKDLVKRSIHGLVEFGYNIHHDVTFAKLSATLVGASLVRDATEMPQNLADIEPFQHFDVANDGDFPSYWRLLAAGASRCGMKGSVTDIMAKLTCTPATVLLVSLVCSGAHTHHLALYNVVTGQRRTNSGTIHDVLGEMLNLTSKQIIMVPTSRTDREILFACRSAMTKGGKEVHVVFPINIDSRFRTVYEADVAKMGEKMALTAEWSGTEDIAWHVRLACGAQVRHQIATKDSYLNNEATAAAASGDPLITSQVQTYLDKLKLPARVEKETAMSTGLLGNYCVISSITAEVPSYRRTDNPMEQDNFIVGLAFMMNGNESTICLPLRPTLSRAELQLPSLDGVDTLVLHDAKHTLLFLWDHPTIKNFIARGGRVWCAMLAEYLLSGQRSRAPDNSLQHIAGSYGVQIPAQRRIGTDNRKASIYSHYPRLKQELLGLDASFKGQVKRGVEGSQLLSLTHRMDSLLAMAEMEFRGIHLDRGVSEGLVRNTHNEVVVLENLLQNCVPQCIPLDQQRYFSWGTPSHVDAYFLGGQINLALQEEDMIASNNSIVVEMLFDADKLDAGCNLQTLISYARERDIPIVENSAMEGIVKHLRQQTVEARLDFRIIVFDLETTGLNPQSDKIIEMCFVDPVTNEKISTFINPQRPIPHETTVIHGITDDMVKDAPTMEQSIPELMKFLRLTPETARPNERILLMAHNVYGIDMPLLRRAFYMHNPHFNWDRVAFVDSLTMFRQQQDTYHTSFRLGSLLEDHGITPRGDLHRAESDVLGLWDCMVEAFIPERNVVDPLKHHKEILNAIVFNIEANPNNHCMSGLLSEYVNAAKADLPGVFNEFFPDDKRGTIMRRMKKNGIDKTALREFKEKGCTTAELLLRVADLSQGKGGLLHVDRQGKLAYLHEVDDCVHQAINMCSTTTSRTISTSPSCQNLPKDDKSTIRTAFTSRFGDQGYVVEVDFKQLEIVVMAILCGDEALLNDLRNGVDFHARRVPFFKPGLTYEYVMERLKAKDPEMKEMRRKAKTVSFQRLYGGGIDMISKTTKLPKDIVQRLVDEENAMYPGIKRYHELVRAVGLRAGNPGLPACYLFELPTGCRMSFQHQDITKNLPPVKNYPIQGYGAEIVQIMLGRLMRNLVERNFFDNRAFLVNFVHDSVWMDIHQDVAEDAIRLCASTLASADQYITETFPGVEIGMPLGVTAEYGRSMASLEDCPPAWLPQ